MKKAMLDTDIFSEVTKARNPTVIARMQVYRQHYPKLTISVATVLEVLRGHHRKQRLDAAAKFSEQLGTIEVLSMDIDVAAIAGQIDGELQLAGKSIGLGDVIIAAVALHHQLTLVTGNTAHFQYVIDLGYPLQLDNWRN